MKFQEWEKPMYSQEEQAMAKSVNSGTENIKQIIYDYNDAADAACSIDYAYLQLCPGEMGNNGYWTAELVDCEGKTITRGGEELFWNDKDLFRAITMLDYKIKDLMEGKE